MFVSLPFFEINSVGILQFVYLVGVLVMNFESFGYFTGERADIYGFYYNIFKFVLVFEILRMALKYISKKSSPKLEDADKELIYGM
jgi:hypothetical protein